MILVSLRINSQQIKVIKGHYIEIFKEMKDGDIYYLDSKETAIIPCYCIVGICPALDPVMEKRHGKKDHSELW